MKNRRPDHEARIEIPQLTSAQLMMTHPWKTKLELALAQAQAADFQGMRSTCDQITADHQDSELAMLDVGALLLNFGYIQCARNCFERVLELSPQDPRARLNLANCARDFGDHALAHKLYSALMEQHPHNAVIRRNVLVSQQYNPAIEDEELLSNAKHWGEWAIALAGGAKPRPSPHPLRKSEGGRPRPLRVGYVSADLCQHTVGLFVKAVIRSHQSYSSDQGVQTPVEVFAYSSGHINDWVTNEIRASCTLRDVSPLNDLDLANTVRQDQVDVLVDLSGHTAGSRLTAFAHRPAHTQVSWLGYFATTGLGYIDAVLLDRWHSPAGTESQFVERVVLLERGRLCYQPVPWAPEVARLPCISSGIVTFGSFNNTGKLNRQVLDLWSQVLAAVPDSRLVLKWRTLADESLCEAIHSGFAERGTDPRRIELRPASFHVDALDQYADIDIALDPFPFTGGLTSCEALWMGVPVITLPQGRAVSRQTFALLSAIGRAEWSASDASHYVAIAQRLARNKEHLAGVRATMRKTMRASTLMDVDGFTRGLEATFYAMHNSQLD